MISGTRSRLRVARFAAALLSVAWTSVILLPPAPARAQATADVSLDDVVLRFGEIVYRAPRLVFRGTPRSRAELVRLLDTASPEPLAQRVAMLDAAEISAPELVSEMMSPQGLQRTTYRDVLFTKIQAGRIASITAAGGTIETATSSGGTIATADAAKLVTGRFERFTLQDLDLGRTLSLFAAKAGPETGLQRVYGSFAMEGLSLTDAKGLTTRIGRLSGRDFSAKPTATGWIETMNALAATPDLKAASPEARRRSTDAMAELFDSFQLGSVEAADVAFGSADPDAGSGRIRRIGFSSAAETGGTFAIEGFETVTKDVAVRFGALTLGGLTAKPLIEAMRDMGRSPTGQISPAGLRRMSPASGSLKLDGLQVDLGSASGPSKAAGTRDMRVTLGTVELVAAKPVEGLPSDLRLTLRNIAFPVPANPDDASLKQLSSLGYERVDASLSMSLGWNEAGQELLVREVSVEGADMGTVAVRAVIGNVGRDAFNPDSAIASVSLLGAAAKSMEIALDNRGLFERFVVREAGRQKRQPEDVRREYGMTAAVGIPAVLGNSPNAKALAQAVSRFVAKPGRLTISARAKQPSGYGVADFAAGPDPASVLNALEITATAE